MTCVPFQSRGPIRPSLTGPTDRGGPTAPGRADGRCVCSAAALTSSLRAIELNQQAQRPHSSVVFVVAEQVVDRYDAVNCCSPTACASELDTGPRTRDHCAPPHRRPSIALKSGKQHFNGLVWSSMPRSKPQGDGPVACSRVPFAADDTPRKSSPGHRRPTKTPSRVIWPSAKRPPSSSITCCWWSRYFEGNAPHRAFSATFADAADHLGWRDRGRNKSLSPLTARVTQLLTTPGCTEFDALILQDSRASTERSAGHHQQGSFPPPAVRRRGRCHCSRGLRSGHSQLHASRQNGGPLARWFLAAPCQRGAHCRCQRGKAVCLS